MAKMFYSLDEAAQKLKVSPEAVKEMADKRQLEVFRDRDRLMFKVEQVDLLAGGKSGGEDEVIALADSSSELEPIGLASSGSAASMGSGLNLGGSGAPMESPKEQTGISIFDADATDDSDPSAVTRVTSAPLQGLAATSAGDSSAGSGIMDLGQGTGFGQGLAEDAFGVTSNAGSGSVDAEGSGAGAAAGGALFEGGGGGDVSPVGAGMVPMAAMVAAEPYDGVWSGVLGGVAFGAIVTLLMSMFAVVLVLSGSGTDFLEKLGQNIWAVVGGLAGLTVVAGVIGMVIGKRS
ncbi:MAG: helix-turn-helix domain-containing protein [Phycisphaerales bacterium]